MRLPFFRWHRFRPSTKVARLVTNGTEPAPLPLAPQPHDLIDVVGVGATENVAGVALTLMSLERYREGHIALFRLLRPRGRFEREFPSPRLEIAVIPEGTIPYRFWMRGGSSGGMRELEYRQSYAIVPAPSTDAAEIVIEVSEISWERWYGAGTRKVVSVDAGPWRFTVRLPPTA